SPHGAQRNAGRAFPDFAHAPSGLDYCDCTEQDLDPFPPRRREGNRTAMKRKGGRRPMAKPNRSLRAALLAGSMLAVWPALAAEVTPERLVNPDKEPQNWLMNHRSYDGQRFSPLDRINRGNVKGLKLAYAVAL